MKASRIRAYAREYLGLKENPPNSNNVIFNTDFYGYEVNGIAYSWCVSAWWDIFRMLGASELFYGGGKTASCGELRSYAIQHGQWVTSSYRLGDLVIYDWELNGKLNTDHAGFVQSVSPDGKLVTLEGNTGIGNDSNGGEFMERTRSLRNVIGAYRPDYEPEDAAAMTDAQFKEQLFRVLSISGTGDNADAWAKEATDALKNTGIFLGDGQGNYGWQLPASREAVALVLYTVLEKLGLLDELTGDKTTEAITPADP